jgi:hypothetical protein
MDTSTATTAPFTWLSLIILTLLLVDRIVERAMALCYHSKCNLCGGKLVSVEMDKDDSEEHSPHQQPSSSEASVDSSK